MQHRRNFLQFFCKLFLYVVAYDANLVGEAFIALQTAVKLEGHADVRNDEFHRLLNRLDGLPVKRGLEFDRIRFAGTHQDVNVRLQDHDIPPNTRNASVYFS